MLVLWLVAVIGVMATGHARIASAETRLAKLHRDSAQARAFAEAGIHRAVLDLLAPAAQRQWSADGTERTFGFEGRIVSVSVRDARGLVDLNAASSNVLSALVGAAGVEDTDREMLVDAILDWRDEDDFKHLKGAEDDDYRAAGLPWTARDGAFTSVEELRYVLGMNEHLYSTIAPLLTVYSGGVGVDLEFASEELIALLRGEELMVSAQESDSARAKVNSNGSIFHVRSRVVVGDQGGVLLEAVIGLSMDQQAPFTVLSWREDARNPHSALRETQT